MNAQLQAAVGKVVTETDDISVPQLATILLAVVATFNDHGRELADAIKEQIGTDREQYEEGFAQLADILEEEG